jgi:hypothetical protein
MSSIDEDERSFYDASGPLTEISRFEKQLCDLPNDIAGLVEIVQGWMLHIFWAGQLGQMLTTQRIEEVNIRSADLKLQRILKIDSSPLTLARSLDHRLVGNCRDYSLMMTALLKYRKIPARARCGFATYFTEGKFEDHWIVEYWNHQQQRWKWSTPNWMNFSEINSTLHSILWIYPKDHSYRPDGHGKCAGNIRPILINSVFRDGMVSNSYWEISRETCWR